jgi:Family of unknown function (DUF5681)
MAKRDTNAQSDGYEVGYAKPPESRQFRKGASGNPKGRPKGAKSMSSILAKVGRERVKMTVNGRPRITTKQEAFVLQLVTRAANGDLKAGRDLMMALRFFPEPEELPESTALLTERDEAVLQSICERMRLSDAQPETKNISESSDVAPGSTEGECA